MNASPAFSVLTAVWNTEPRALRRCVESVLAQRYPHWELCLVDDGSTRRDTMAALQRLAGLSPRVRVSVGVHQGISAAQNAALAMARGEFVALLDHDDELEPDALSEIAGVIGAHPDADVIYTDEDCGPARAPRRACYHKPGWSPTFLLSAPYFNHLTVYRRQLVVDMAGFREDYELAQDWDLALRVTAVTDRVHHVSRVLYHWNTSDTSAGVRADAQYWRRRCHEDHALARYGPEARSRDAAIPGFFHTERPLRGEPMVSVIVPTAGQRARVGGEPVTLVLRCLHALRAGTDYPNYEVLCVVDPRTPPDARAALQQERDAHEGRLTLVHATTPFSFTDRVKLGAELARGEHLLLLNDDTWPLTPAWMTAMVRLSQEPAIGVVGAKLRFPDGTIEHGGVSVTSPRGYPFCPLRGYPADHPGHMGSLIVERDFFAVTGACQMTRADVFRELGGYSPEFPINWGDIDYCLRARAAGYRVVVTPVAELEHCEAASRPRTGTGEEIDRWGEKWGHAVDPYWRREAATAQSYFAHTPLSTAAATQGPVEADGGRVEPGGRSG